jgi:hypothetical protein
VEGEGVSSFLKDSTTCLRSTRTEVREKDLFFVSRMMDGCIDESIGSFFLLGAQEFEFLVNNWLVLGSDGGCLAAF